MIERYKHLAPDYMAEIFKKTEFLKKREETTSSPEEKTKAPRNDTSIITAR